MLVIAPKENLARTLPSRVAVVIVSSRGVKLPWPAERPANNYDHAPRVYLSASVDHHTLTDTVRVAEARANSPVLRLASELMGEIVAVKAAEGHAFDGP